MSEMIKAEVFLDSIGADGSAPRLITWKLTLPRYILAEINTHRMFSRNYPSSRAIPVPKRMKMVEDEPVIPIEWGLVETGMQAKRVADETTTACAEGIWREAAKDALRHAKALHELGIHQQVVNRLLEPFVTVTGLVTSILPGLENATALRADDHADPHIKKLFYQMIDLANASTPTVLQPGAWHIPFGDQMPEGLEWPDRLKVAVARTARVSYNNFEGTQDLKKDFALHDQLAANGHWSSFEHIAQVPPMPLMGHDLCGNLPGWVQLRKLYANECRKDPRILAK